MKKLFLPFVNTRSCKKERKGEVLSVTIILNIKNQIVTK